MGRNKARPVSMSVYSAEMDEDECMNDADTEDDSQFRKRLNEDKKRPRCWATTEHRDAFWPSTHVEQFITPGLYKVTEVGGIGIVLKKITVTTDEIIMVDPSGPMQRVINEIVRFWSPEIKDRYKEHGFLHKRGILMHGDPGSGKTATVQYLINQLIEMGGIALYSQHSTLLTEGLQMVRSIQPEIPIIVVMEDFELLVSRHHDENEWLSLMDGESQVDNVVFLATTNYAEKLDKRFIDRPSRFDLIEPVLMPSAKTRAVFLSKKAPQLTLNEIKQWVSNTEGFSVAHLKEMIISVCVLGYDLDQTADRMREMRERKVSTEGLGENDSGFGFGNRPISADREVVDWEQFEAEYLNA